MRRRIAAARRPVEIQLFRASAAEAGRRGGSDERLGQRPAAGLPPHRALTLTQRSATLGAPTFSLLINLEYCGSSVGRDPRLCCSNRRHLEMTQPLTKDEIERRLFNAQRR
jgi:hypothetical protein